MTAMSKPNPTTLRKWRFSTVPTSMARVWPAATMRAAAAGSCAGTSRDLARSQPVPPATRPRATSWPERRIALPTLLQVPSPPRATRRRCPWAMACCAMVTSSPERVLSAWATDAPPVASVRAARTGCTSRPPRPLPDAGLTTTKMSSGADKCGSGRFELFQGLERLQAVAHPLLAEGDVVDVGDGEHLVEGMVVQLDAPLLVLVLAVLPFHGDLGQVVRLAVFHEGLVQVGDGMPLVLV